MNITGQILEIPVSEIINFKPWNWARFDCTDPYDDDALDEGYIDLILMPEDIETITAEGIDASRYSSVTLNQEFVEKLGMDEIMISPKLIQTEHKSYFEISFWILMKVNKKSVEIQFVIRSECSVSKVHELQNVISYRSEKIEQMKDLE